MTSEIIIKKLFLNFDCRTVGEEIQLCCFLCKEKRYRLYINRKKILGHCFNCGRSINEVFLKKFFKITREDKIYEKTDFSFLESFRKNPNLSDNRDFFIPGIVAHSYDPKLHIQYVKVRDGCIQFLEKRGFDYTYICKQYNLILGDPGSSCAGRLILPIFENGEIVYYQARSVFNEVPKYINPRKSALGKSDVVFNLDKISVGSSVIICEGIFSAISCGNSAVAVLGKELSETQKFKILAKKPSEIIILLDAGEIDASIKMAKCFYGRADVKIAKLLTGDPNEVSFEELRGAIENAELYFDLINF